MMSAKVLKLGLVAAALLLIPRRSSRQADIKVNATPYAKTINDDDIDDIEVVDISNTDACDADSLTPP